MADETEAPQVSSTLEKDVTHWRHVRYDGSQSPWFTRDEPGRGFVAYARRSFRKGEKICSEFPTVWIHGHHPFNDTQIEEIHTKVNALDDNDKDAFFAMANVFPEFPPAVGIFMTNCFDMTDSIYGTCCAMYLALARLNHSCCPNAQQTHIPTTTEEVLFAARDIAEGEEINDCYIDLRQNRNNRRHELQEYYRFHCTCIACNESNDNLVNEEDALRIRASEISDKIVDLITADDEDEDNVDNSSKKRRCISALTMALQLKNDLTAVSSVFTVGPMSSERWCIRYLPELYMLIYQLCDTLAEEHAQSSKKTKASKTMAKRFRDESVSYLSQARDLTKCLQGESSPEFQRLDELLATLKR